MKNLFFLLILLSCTKQINTLDIQKFSNASAVVARPNDPVVISGNSWNILPTELVAFKFYSGVWFQIPVQVDEKVNADVSKGYNGDYATTGYNVSFYADAGTYIGGDTNPLIDSDDEIVFMQKDAGELADSSFPTGVLQDFRKQISIDSSSYVYLFKNAGTLTQNAGVNYVAYQYALTSGSYLSTFKRNNARNPENSNVITSKYKINFTAEWLMPGLFLGNVDILDRHKMFFGDGYCTRTEETFSDGENCFLTNHTGPIRAIRSVMGANSGQYTQRTWIFYEGRVDVITDLRVHAIGGICDVFDYSPFANGMKYTNDLNLAPLTIDGIKEIPVKGPIQWELVTGSLGSLVQLQRRATTFTTAEGIPSSYWDDTKTKPASNCTGDGQAWGTSGTTMQFTNQSLYTEPWKGNFQYTSPNFRLLKTTRIVYFETPNLSNSIAQTYNTQYNTPVKIVIN